MIGLAEGEPKKPLTFQDLKHGDVFRIAGRVLYLKVNPGVFLSANNPSNQPNTICLNNCTLYATRCETEVTKIEAGTKLIVE